MVIITTQKKETKNKKHTIRFFHDKRLKRKEIKRAQIYFEHPGRRE